MNAARGRSIWMLCLSLLLLVSVFSVVPAQAASSSEQEIVVVVKVGGIPWFNLMGEGVEQAGKDLGIRASLIGPSTADAAAQVAMVEDLVNRGVSAIGVVPTDAKALVPVFNRARERGIVILTNESPFDTEAVDYDIELIDSEAYAKLAVDQMVQSLRDNGIPCTPDKPCGYVMLVGGLTVPLHNYWADVAYEYARQNYPGLRELTSRLPTAESVDDSRRAVLDLIRGYGASLNGVIGWGSLGPLGAGAAVRERGLQNRIAVGGSAIPSSVASYFADGSVDWAQLWNPRDCGYAMVWVAKQILDGKKITTGMEAPGLGPLTLTDKIISFNRILLARSAEEARAAGF